ncbi:MAG: trimethylamine methyltransferase family protein, partial [Bacillota bacterium]
MVVPHALPGPRTWCGWCGWLTRCRRSSFSPRRWWLARLPRCSATRIGSTSTLAGSVAIHTAETLSGVVLAQTVRPGARLVWGGESVRR